MTYQRDLQALADTAEAQAANLYSAYKSGKIDEATFKAATVEVMLVLMHAANQVADAALAKLLTQQTGTMVMPIGTVSIDAPDHLAKALETILLNPNSDMSIRRLARSETLSSAQLGWGTAMQQQPGVTGWTRGIHAGACDICQRLTGTVLSLATPIWHHPGCTCYQKPVTRAYQA